MKKVRVKFKILPGEVFAVDTEGYSYVDGEEVEEKKTLADKFYSQGGIEFIICSSLARIAREHYLKAFDEAFELWSGDIEYCRKFIREQLEKA